MKKYLPLTILAVMILVGAFKCPLYAYMGLPCPSCGMTRAWKLLLSGKISDAFLMHPLFWMPPLLLLPMFRKKWVIVGMTVLLLAVYVLRMIMMFPDVAPMNYNYDSVVGGFIK